MNHPIVILRSALAKTESGHDAIPFIHAAIDAIYELMKEHKKKEENLMWTIHDNLYRWDNQVIGMQERIAELEEENEKLADIIYDWEEGVNVKNE